MRYTLVSPRLAVQKGDFLGSGVPYWPLELAMLAGCVRERGDEVTVIDSFGASPTTFEERKDHYLQGAPLERWRASAEVRDAQVFVVFAISVMSHADSLDIVRRLRRWRPDARVLVLENSQAVTAYALLTVQGDFFGAGADVLLRGEILTSWDGIADWLRDGGEPPDGVVLQNRAVGRRATRATLPRLPLPAWDLFPIEQYWALPYAHGPKVDRYLPVLTSFGCPYPCAFCVAPETTGRRWQGRAAEEVVEEWVSLRDRYGVRHFQVEDLNPTIQAARWRSIAARLIEDGADVTFAFASGTKAETIPLDDVAQLACAGLNYLSISPESGSKSVRSAIGKRFDHEHGLGLVERCRMHGVATQACFLVGYPGETDADHRQSVEYLRALVRAGLDEVAIFVVAPLPGSKLFGEGQLELKDDGALVSFSPKGRSDWRQVSARRRALIRVFFGEKLRSGSEIWKSVLRATVGHPRTKMENLPRRVAFVASRLAALQARKLLPSPGRGQK